MFTLILTIYKNFFLIQFLMHCIFQIGFVFIFDLFCLVFFNNYNKRMVLLVRVNS